MSRMQDVGVLLYNHNRDKVIGTILRAWIENGRGMATVKFDDDADSEIIRAKVASGTLKGVSVGYRVTNYESVKEGAKSLDGRFAGPCYVAKKWMPYEISIVSVPADATVGVGRELGEDGPQPDAAERPALSYFESCITANKNH